MSIVSASSCPAELISSYLDLVFSPLVQSLPAYIRDSSDALRQFWNFQLAGFSCLLFTMAVQCLYMSNPHPNGLGALCFFLEQRPESFRTPATTLLCLAKLILTLNNFSVNSFHFLQIRGLVMSTRMGSSDACLFMEASLAANIHYKPIDSYSYLDYISSHPASYEDSIPFSQFLHLC
eukprot:g34210.t1